MSVQNQVRPIIVKKIIDGGHGGHHGGAWKVAYADFVTAMMAFFLLMWLLGATTEKQRKSIADYFAPTTAMTRTESAGGNGLFGGSSITSVDKYPNAAGQTGSRSLTIPRDSTGGPKEASGAKKESDRRRFENVRDVIMKRMMANPNLRRLAKNMRFTETEEGLRIDLVDESDFSMFGMGTDRMTPDAIQMLREVGDVIRQVPNGIKIRGHTDSFTWEKDPRGANNWRLSVERAEVTRRFLAGQRIENERFMRIEGVADREPYNPEDGFDPRNRRMSIILGWS
jgi:chemotaxis protein MotB